MRTCSTVQYTTALQMVRTVHQNVREVHHYKRVHKGASQTCHTKQILFQKLSVSESGPLTNQ